MKNFLILFFAVILFLPYSSADAQSKRKKAVSEDVGEQISSEIERFVDRITGRWDFPDNQEQIAPEDTLPPPSSHSSEITDSETDKSARTFSGNKVIEESETVTGNVVVKGGDLTIYGTVDGDVMVVGGDLLMKSTGRVTGNARVISGTIKKEEGSVIEGYEDKTRSEKTNYRETQRRFSRSGRSFDVPWLDESSLDNFVFRYNRVESVFLGVGSVKKYYWDGEKSWNAFGSIGWGFKSHTWRGNLGLSRQFAILSNEGNSIIELGAEGYSLTDTKDQWIISLHENTAAAFLFHEDFRDYYERNGYTVHVAYYSKHDYLKSELKAAYQADMYDSLTNRIEWALFGGDKLFRQNPAIVPGKIHSVLFSAGVSTVSKTSYGPEGWTLLASTEFAKKSWGGEFDFDQYIFDLRRFQPLDRFDNFNVRLRVGSGGGVLPLQRAYELGGVGTLNGFPFKSEIGNRMVLMNAELIINGSFLDDLDFWPTWFFRHFNFLLTSDAGFTRTVGSKASALDGFENVKWNEFKHNFGLAFANRSGSFRIGIAWRTDYPAPAQFILRFNRPF